MNELAGILSLRAEGVSVNETARRLGIGRGAVLGRLAAARRSGISIPPPPPKPPRPSPIRDRLPICGCGGRHFAGRQHAGPIARTCPHCTEPFSSPRLRKFCSPACATAYHRSLNRDLRRASRKTTSKPERIFRDLVFERDEWICGVCSRPVDRHLKATDQMGPTLDHVIPLARGGQHVESNVQLAHRACNLRKGVS